MFYLKKFLENCLDCREEETQKSSKLSQSPVPAFWDSPESTYQQSVLRSADQPWCQRSEEAQRERVEGPAQRLCGGAPSLQQLLRRDAHSARCRQRPLRVTATRLRPGPRPRPRPRGSRHHAPPPGSLHPGHDLLQAGLCRVSVRVLTEDLGNRRSNKSDEGHK